ncbi:MAG TPA: 16S rRNA (adenine(1518)-N(6)/adenine(1519)-N(6))-dimethyltransferase RsmA [Vicinamibacterales bacterium]|nr:16S rRNA (adenine(1518)-N(6)/adenine(1519)-N(6))-dimethyltransferase RsmA [Vicinamibacterales bacterium]
MRPAVRHRPRKRFGQHFLAPAWAQKIVAAIAPAPGDVLLEIGPGAGALTKPLAATGVPILAVEVDRDLVAALAPQVPPNVTIVSGDIMTIDVVPYLYGLGSQQSPLNAGPQPSRRVRVVGNLPYNLTSPILFRLVKLQEQHGVFFDATLMVQREVADRLAARPRSKDYGVLTITMQLAGKMEKLLTLPPGAFKPAPKVWSSVVRLRFGPPPVRIADRALFEKVVKAAFGQRRKTLANCLRGLVKQPDDVLDGAGIDPRRRAETLSLEELARLTTQCAGALKLR